MYLNRVTLIGFTGTGAKDICHAFREGDHPLVGGYG
jgi:hypothetical protein